MNAGRLLHHVFARQVVAARFENVNHEVRQLVAPKVKIIRDIAGRIVFLHPRQPLLVLGIVVRPPQASSSVVAALVELELKGALPAVTTVCTGAATLP